MSDDHALDSTERAAGTRIAPRRFGPARREVGSYLELLALTGIAVAQPVFDIVGKDATVFLTRGAGPVEIVLYALVVVLAPPTVLWSVEVLVGLALPRARRWAHILVVAALAVLIADEVVKKATSWEWRSIVAASLVGGVVATILFLRFEALQVWVRYLAIAPLVFAGLFLFSSPVSALVLGDDSGAAAHVTVARPHRVVMIVFDEFPLESLLDGTGHIDATRYPHFAELARASTWYRNDGTVAPFTGAAVPAILTGRNPTSGSTAPVAAEYPQNIFTLLGGSYHMNVHESVTQLCPTDLCAGATPAGGNPGGPGFTGMLRQSYDTWRDFWAPGRRTTRNPFNEGDTRRITTIARDFVDSIKRDDGPRFDFLHVLLPHEPWHLTASQDYLTQQREGLFLYGWVDQWAALSAHQRHLLQLQAADTLVGRVIAKLKSIGAWDDSLVVVTADHGAAFIGKQPFRGVSAQNYPQIVWTPLFVRAPGQTVRSIDDRFARSIDIVPTVADLLGVRIPWKVDGRSLRGSPAPDDTRHVLEWGYNVLQPPNGSIFVDVNGPSGFARVLAANPWPDGGDPALELFRIGPYGDLVGAPLDRLLHARSTVDGRVDDPTVYDHVVPDAAQAPWIRITGKLDVSTGGRAVAITVDGVVAGMSATVATTNGSRFWGVLAPQLFHRGHNDIGLALVDGDPRAPRVTPVRLTG
jgi:hypothetical protein